MMILLTGGAASGKSFYGEQFCLSQPAPRYYVAAMKPTEESERRRVEKNRRLRGSSWENAIEKYTNLEKIHLPKKGTVLLECICNLTANEMFDDETGEYRDPFESVIKGVRELKKQCKTLVVITNEVSSDGFLYSPETEAYREALGRINQALAEEADRVVELVAGIPMVRKGEEKE
jgi:adenosylcobinamide kinase/adenosylcobinamide-phosphate guanylyltransferase